MRNVGLHLGESAIVQVVHAAIWAFPRWRHPRSRVSTGVDGHAASEASLRAHTRLFVRVRPSARGFDVTFALLRLAILQVGGTQGASSLVPCEDGWQATVALPLSDRSVGAPTCTYLSFPLATASFPRALRGQFGCEHQTALAKTHPSIHTTVDGCFTTTSQRPWPSSSSVPLPFVPSPGPDPIYRRGSPSFLCAILIGYGPLWPLHEPNGPTPNGSPNGTDRLIPNPVEESVSIILDSSAADVGCLGRGCRVMDDAHQFGSRLHVRRTHFKRFWRWTCRLERREKRSGRTPAKLERCVVGRKGSKGSTTSVPRTRTSSTWQSCTKTRCWRCERQAKVWTRRKGWNVDECHVHLDVIRST